MIESIHVFFSGTVQGVGFRQTTFGIAQQYEVVGFVQNLSDGRVELVAEGEGEMVGRFVDHVCDHLSDKIRSKTVDRSVLNNTQFAAFEIRYA